MFVPDPMRSHIKHHRPPVFAALTVAALLGCLLSSGCRPRLTPLTGQASPSAEAGLRAIASPTLQLSATPSPSPQPTLLPTLEPTQSPTPDARALQAYGTLLYLDGRSVWEGWGLVSDRLIAELPFEEIATARLVGNRLWMLADGHLAVVDLTFGAVETLAELEPSTGRREGRLLVLPDDRVVYSMLVDEWGGGAGYATTVWLYDPQTGQARILAKRDAGLAVLAPMRKGDALYAAPIGGDGALTAIVTIDLEDGAIASAVEFQRVGMGGLALSPDGRKVAISDAQNWGQADVQGCITIYDLAEPGAAPVTIVLPKQPSYAFSLTWAPDNRYLYFALEANPWVADASGHPLEQAYGLWRADAHSGELRGITPSHSDRFPRPVMISPDGRALLVSSIPYDLVDVQTGELFSSTLPPLALILDWRMSDVQ